MADHDWPWLKEQLRALGWEESRVEDAMWTPWLERHWYARPEFSGRVLASRGVRVEMFRTAPRAWEFLKHLRKPEEMRRAG